MFKKNNKIILTTFLFAVLVLGGMLLSIPLFYSNNIPISQAEKVVYSVPVEIKIPSINVNAPIEEVGITQDGTMGAPEGPLDTGWYNLGPRPGEIGAAVIDGHSGWKDGIPAVFDSLHKLQIGDEIYIKDEKGNSLVFMVREIKKYDPEADARDVFYSKDSGAHLNLITCEGAWDEATQSRSMRLVVFTDLVL